MTENNRLSNNTQIYLEQYHRILEGMIEKMSAAAQMESISGNFIAQMIPHHRAAIDMSENLLQFTTNIPLQSIARNIISSQTQSIAGVATVYPECKSLVSAPRDLAAYRTKDEALLNKMFYEMGTARLGNSIDCNFMREMIPHHRGAVLMAENALRLPLCPGLAPLLNAIITSQKRGICEMQQLLRRMGC